jgi:hypothetical protein
METLLVILLFAVCPIAYYAWKEYHNSHGRVKPVNTREGIELIRWLGFLSGITIVIDLLLFPRISLGSYPNGQDIGLFLVFCIVPAFVAAIISLARRYWLLIPPALWFGGIAFVGRLDKDPPRGSTLLLLAAITMLIVPFLAWTLRPQKKPVADQQEEVM